MTNRILEFVVGDVTVTIRVEEFHDLPDNKNQCRSCSANSYEGGYAFLKSTWSNSLFVKKHPKRSHMAPMFLRFMYPTLSLSSARKACPTLLQCNCILLKKSGGSPPVSSTPMSFPILLVRSHLRYALPPPLHSWSFL
jgi:hypothetical protein